MLVEWVAVVLSVEVYIVAAEQVVWLAAAVLLAEPEVVQRAVE